MTVREPETAQPLTKSRETTFLQGAVAIEREVTDDDITPRPAYKTIGLNSSSDTLKANNAKPSFDLRAQYTPAAPSATASSRSSTLASSKADRDQLAIIALTPAEPSPAPPTRRNKFSISRKKKRLEKQAQELEEQRLKQEANEALRRKHGEYHPPGHTPGLIHSHRPPQHHDHQQIERSRSLTNMRQQYQQPSQPQMHRYPSTSRVASPVSFHSLSSPTSPRSHTSSTSSSTYSSRHNSYTNGQTPQRPTSPMREQRSVQIDLSQVHPQLDDLEGLDEGILSEHWNSDSDDDHDLSFHRSGYPNSSKRSMDSASESSYHTDQSSINPPSAITRHQSRASRSALSIDTRSLPTHSNHHPSISQQIQGDSRFSDYRSDSRLSNYCRGDSRLSNYPEDHDHSVVEMTEVKSPSGAPLHDQSRHQSWPLNGDRLMPRDPHEQHRSVSSLSRYPTPARSRDPLVERYLMNKEGTGSLASTGIPSTTNFHSHRHNDLPQYGRRLSSDMTAAEALRAKAGSRATYRTRDDTWSAQETEASQDGHNHNYLAPLPPFQSGPAYTRVPKRKYCRWCCGGCRWWVLLLCIAIPAGVIALVAAILWQRFQMCKPIDPNGVAPMVYLVDPTTIQGIALEYQTITGGSIRIVDSPDPNEYKVIMRLQRQFHNMERREDLTGFHSEYLSNGYMKYVLDDTANNQRGFFVAPVLCSTSILTIEMPRTLPGRAEINLDALIDQQDLTIDLDESLLRNATWRIRTLSNKNVTVKSLNINALAVSSASTTPLSIVLESVIVHDQLSVVSVSGNIQAAVGFDQSPGSTYTTTASRPPQPTSTSGPPASAMVNLSTLDGEIRFDLKAWNQTCTFKVDSPAIQVTKAGAMVLNFMNSTNGESGAQNQTHIDRSGLVVDLGYNSVSGMFKPLSVNGTVVPSNTTTPTPTATTGAATTTTVSSTKSSSVKPTTTTLLTPTPIALPGPQLGAGGSLVPAQLLMQANRKVIINFP